MTPKSTSGSGGSQALLAAASVVIILAGLRAAAPFLVPLMLAVFLTVINLPVLAWLRRLRVPSPLAVLLVVLFTFGLLGLIGWVGTESLSDIRASLPEYARRLEQVESAIVGTLREFGIDVPPGLYADFAAPDRIVGLASGVVVEAAALVSSAFVVLLYTIFMLAEAAGFPRKLRAAIGRTDADLGQLAEVVGDIQRYLAIKTAISLATGLLVGLWLWGLGVDFALLWGLVAFVLNYVPNVGSVVASIPGVLFALLQFGPGVAAIAAAGYLVVNFLLGNLLEPHVMGRGFGLSTLIVVISLVFWGWLWGPIGMLLSVPLTIIVRIAIEYVDDLRWLAVLLGSSAEQQATAEAAAPEALPAGESLAAEG